jgi:hypothetical protein
MNLSYLLRIDDPEAPVVLGIFVRDPAVCQKEIQLLRSVSKLLPVPELIYAAPNGEDDVGSYVFYRCAEGITFQELKAKRSRRQEVFGILQDLKGGRPGRWSSPGCGEQAVPLYRVKPRDCYNGNRTPALSSNG